MPISAGRQLILVIEDDSDAREAIAMYLGIRGYDVAEAPNGRDGLEAMRKRPPAAVVLDLTMPVMDGWTFHKHMRADPSLSQVPVVVVSGVSDIGPELHDCAILKKPVDVEKLVAVLERCTAR